MYISPDVRAQSEGTLVPYTGSVEYDVLEKAVRNGAPEVMTIQDSTLRESLEFLREHAAREGEDFPGVMAEDQDADESLEVSEDRGEAPPTRPRGSVWHAPFSLSILLLAWSIILVTGVGSWWGWLLLGISCFNLFVAVATAAIYGRYTGPFMGRGKH